MLFYCSCFYAKEGIFFTNQPCALWHWTQVANLTISYPASYTTSAALQSTGIQLVADAGPAATSASAASAQANAAADAAQASFLAVAAADTTPPVVTLLGSEQVQLLEGLQFQGEDWAQPRHKCTECSLEAGMHAPLLLVILRSSFP
jgi:hypothetical protein